MLILRVQEKTGKEDKGMNNPYAEKVMEYYQGGWTPLWLPYAKKSSPKKGYTGANAQEPSEETLFLDWMEEPGNIALKLPDNILGIDVDRDKKTGETTGWNKLKKLEKQLGELPIQVVSTSRETLAEGFTAFFKIPKGVEWKSGVGGSIDIIRGGHRYQVVAPSIHDTTGRTYEWRNYEDNRQTPFSPETDDLPELPLAWIEYLTKPKEVEKAPRATEAPVSPWEDEVEQEHADSHTEPPKEACATMRAILNRRTRDLRNTKTSRHDTMVLATWAIVSEAHKGHTGEKNTLQRYLQKWAKKFSEKEKAERNLSAEFYSAVYGAKKKQEGNPKGTCKCGAGTSSQKYTKVRKQRDVKMFR